VARQGISKAAAAVRERAEAEVQRDKGLRLAVVKSADPLRLKVSGSSITLDSDDLIMGQWVRLYAAQDGIKKGDNLMVRKTVEGNWLVTDVVSPDDPSPTSGGATGPTGPTGPTGVTGPHRRHGCRRPDRFHRPHRPDRPDRPNRPNRPNRRNGRNGTHRSNRSNRTHRSNRRNGGNGRDWTGRPVFGVVQLLGRKTHFSQQPGH
jgi:hypothetical protein